MVWWDAWPQFLAAYLCNVGALSFGLQGGWLSPLQLQFQSDESPLSGPPLTDSQISWFGALPSISLTISAPLFGWTMAKYGRRTTLFIAAAPNLITYLLLIFGKNVTLVYISRLLGGFCSCGSFIVGPIYVNEMVQPNFRGPLGSITGFFVKLGIILSFIFGAYTSYLTLNLISLSFTLIFLAIFPWLPESPAYLVSVGKSIEAESAFRKLWRGETYEVISEEIKTIEKNCLQTDSQQPTVRQLLRKFTSDRKLRNAIIIITGIYSFQMLSGYPAIFRFAVDFVSSAGSEFSPYNVAICLATVQLIFAAVGSLLLDKVGRKPLVVFDLFMMAMCMCTLSAYLFITKNYPEFEFVRNLKHLPTVALIIFFACYALGFGTVPFVIISELFGPEERPMASTFLNICFAFVEFVVIKLFHSVSAVIFLHGSVGLFAMFSFIGTGFLSWKMFETKGLTFEEVQRKLIGSKVIIDIDRKVETNSKKSLEKSQPLLPTPKTRPHC